MDEKDARRKRNRGMRWSRGRGLAATAMLCPPGRSSHELLDKPPPTTAAPRFCPPS